MKSILKVSQKGNSTSGSYLAKQDKAWRNRKGNEEHLMLHTEKKKNPKTILVPGASTLSQLGDSIFNLHLDLWSPHNP
jgi:hypothetical protein